MARPLVVVGEAAARVAQLERPPATLQACPARSLAAGGGRARGAYTPGAASWRVWSIVSLCWCSCWTTISQTTGSVADPAPRHLRARARAPPPCSRAPRPGAGRAGRRARRAASRSRRRPPQLRSQRSSPPVRVAQPQVLEGGDVAEVPDQRAHQRVVDAVEVGVARPARRARACARARPREATRPLQGAVSGAPQGHGGASGDYRGPACVARESRATRSRAPRGRRCAPARATRRGRRRAGRWTPRPRP